MEKSVTLLSGLRAGGVGLVALKTLRKLVGNVQKDPGNVKFRSINLENEAIRKRVTKHPGGTLMLEAVGFCKKGTRLVLEDGDVNAQLLAAASEKIEAAIAKLL